MSAIRRSLALLELLSRQGSTRVSQAATALDLPVSSVHRLLAELEDEGFVMRSSFDRRLYTLGPRMFDMAQHRQAEEDLLARSSQRHLQHLVDEFSETAHLVVLRGRNARFIAGRESTFALRAGLRIGVEYPIHCTSGGKAILAGMTDEARMLLLPEETLAGVTRDSVVSRTDLLRELDADRERGWSLNLNESEASIMGVGAAIVDGVGRVRGALVVGGPTSRVTLDDASMLGDELAATAARCGIEL